jgi:hypothetical protein
VIAQPGTEAGGRPLVAVLCRVQLLSEAIRGALAEIADVRVFPAGIGDTEGLLRSLDPDAIVVDDETEAEAAKAFVGETGSATLLHVSLRDERLFVLTEKGWQDETNDGISPESVRNVLVGHLFARGASKV